MRSSRFFREAAPFVAALVLAACNGQGGPNPPAAGLQSRAPDNDIPQWQAQHLARAACPETRPGRAQCWALIGYGKARRGSTVYGWTPADIQSVYNLPSSTKGSGQIVAIVDAYEIPTSPRISQPIVRTSDSALRIFISSIKKASKATIRRRTPAGASRSTSTSTWYRPPVQSAPST